MHDILMITFKRAAFTRMSLERLLDSCDSQMRVWVWHNGSDAETLEIVRSFEQRPRFYKLHVSPENQKLRGPTNWFWQASEGEFVSKVDDDCLLPDGWGGTLRAAHQAEPKLGALGCWRFYDEDFLPEMAGRKIRTFGGGHQVMVHGFVQGSGYVLKRAMIRDCGPIRASESFTSYCLRAANRGWINGWYFPFIHEDHMDDARSPNYPIRTEEEFQADLSLSQKNFGITSLAAWQRFSRLHARHLQTDISDPRSYFGWRGLLRKVNNRLFPRKKFWEV